MSLEDIRAKLPELLGPHFQGNGRYLHASKVKGSAILRLVPSGYCNWCGKPLTGRSRFFCPPSEREIYQGYTQKGYWCAVEFGQWWRLGNPRFKRVIYIRDDFTCQNCGLRPRAQNKHGLDIPDLSLLAIDHIIPFSKGGKTELDNLQVLCRKCNGQKRDKMPTVFQEEQGQGAMELNL